MELGLSLGDAVKPFNFSSENKRVQNKSRGIDFCMRLGLNSCAVETEKASEENGDDGDEISEGDGSDDNEQGETPLQLNLLPFPRRILPHLQSLPWSSDNENGSSAAKGLDVNRPAAMEEASSANSLCMDLVIYRSGSKRDLEATGNDVAEAERASSRASDDDENGNNRKKLRLSKQQAAFLEESFKEHNTLNPKQKQALAKQLNLRARQVEVWFQNRRARTKLKQTEVDCEYLKRCCETLTEENRRLQKELQELRALKSNSYMQRPATTLTMCPSCERKIETTVPKGIPFPLNNRPNFFPFAHQNQPAPS